MVHTINNKFEWDERKSDSNWIKHGISFEEAVEAFEDPAALTLPDVRHSRIHEKREILIGRSIQTILTVIFTVRQPRKRIRIISARRANSKERRLYETQTT